MNKAEQRALEKYPLEDNPCDVDSIIAARINFVDGYNQAEKDLLKNKHEKSWRLDEKLWKGIKDIEEASYQYMYDASNDWAYDIPTWNDVQDAFKAGSEWKEGLELTWEDLATIEKLGDDFIKQNHTPMSDEEFYKEVLKRFNEQRNERSK